MSSAEVGEQCHCGFGAALKTNLDREFLISAHKISSQ